MNDLINNRISLLEPGYVEFVKSDYVYEVAKSLGDKAGFSEKQISVFENAITLYLLFLLSKEELIDFIKTECKTAPATAEELVTTLLLSLPTEFEAKQATTYAELTTNESASESNTVPPAAGSSVTKTAPKPSQPQTQNPTKNDAVPPTIRTMSGDMNKISSTPPPNQQDKDVTHSSSQENILKKGDDDKEKADIRWGNVT